MIAQRRGKNVAVVGLVLQIAFTAVLLAIWLLTGSLAAMATVWLLAGGAAMWLVVVLLFYARRLERQEAFELEQIGDESGMFRGDDASQGNPMAARLAFIERWVVPIFTLLWAAYHACMAIVVWRVIGAGAPEALTHTGRGTMFAILVGFLAFLFSRYATGMGSRIEWRPLRAAGSYLLACVLLLAGSAAALLAASQGYVGLDYWIALAGGLVQMVLAAELLINFVLDMFRPRLPGQEARLSFDSRLLGLLAEPDRVGHSLADAVNYQFGFEVSKTWFYRLLVRSFVPLVLLGAAVLVAISSIVIVNEGQEYVVSRFGRPDPNRPLREAGIYFKLPWPIETARRFDTGRLYELQLGAGHEREEHDAEIITAGAFKGREIALWTKEHGAHEEQDFLLAVPPRTQKDTKAADISIIKLVASMQYRITNAYRFGYEYTDAAKLLQCAAAREMVRYCSSATLDTPIGDDKTSDRPEALMTYGQGPAAKRLKERIAAAVGPEGLDLGVEIVSVSFLTVHPPAEAAKAFEKVIEARLRQRQQRYQAQAQAVRTLSDAAGDPTSALRLVVAIRAGEELGALPSPTRNPEEFDSKLEGYIRTARDDANELRKEIQQDTFRGTDETAENSLKPVLAAYLDYLQRLEGLKNAASKSEAVGILADLTAGARIAAEDLLVALRRGKSAIMLAKASADRWTQELTERGKAESFARQMLLYNASPQTYTLDRWLDTWDTALHGRHKYVLGLDPKRIEHWFRWEGETGVMRRTFRETPDTGEIKR